MAKEVRGVDVILSRLGHQNDVKNGTRSWFRQMLRRKKARERGKLLKLA
jgi:hypothetical protein